MEKPVVLSFGLDRRSLVRLGKFLLRFDAEVREICVEEYSLPIGAIAANLKPRAAYIGQALPEPMLVFAGFPNVMLDIVLDSLKKANIVPPALKAVLTESNVSWTPSMLYNEIKREREFLSRYMKK